MTNQLKFYRYINFFILILSSISTVFAQQKEPIYIYGKLENGLKYYIIPQDKRIPEKLELRLVMPIGSINEGVHQPIGVAHFLEHIAFDGSKHFPKRRMVKYIERLGATFGYGINASTGYDRTIFSLSIPQTSPTVLDSALLIAKDWLSGLTITNKAIHKERKIILQELHKSENTDPFYNVKLGYHSIYALRPPIGNTSSIKRINKSDIENFYQHWYHPQLATLIVSSNLSVDSTINKIKIYFKNIKATNTVIPKRLAINYHRQNPQISLCEDSTRTNYSIDIIFPYQYTSTSTIKDITNNTVRSIVDDIFKKALHNIDINVSNNWYLGKTYHLTFSYKTEDSTQLYHNLNLLNRLFNRFRNNGINDIPDHIISEIKKNSISSISPIPKSITANNLIPYLIDHTIMGDYLLIDSIHCHEARNFIKNLSPQELNEAIHLFLGSNLLYPIIAIKTPILTKQQKKQLELHIKSILLDKSFSPITIKVSEKNNSEDTIDSTQYKKLLYKYSSKQEILKNLIYYPHLNIYEYVYPNGLHLIIKHIKDFTENNTNLVLTSKGGLNIIPDSIYYRLESTTGYIDMGGIGNINDNQLSDLCSYYNIALTSTMSNFDHGFVAKCPNRYLSILLTLIRMKISNSTIPQKGLETCLNEQIQSWNNDEDKALTRMIKQNNDYQLNQNIQDYLQYIPHPSQKEMHKEDLKKITAHEMENFYKRLYETTDNTDVIIVSSLPIDSIVCLFDNTLGSLPPHRLKKNKNTIQFGVNNRPKYIYKILNGNKYNAITIHQIYAFNFPHSLKSLLILKLLRSVINTRLIQTLRENEGIVYSPYISMQYTMYPIPRCVFDIENTIDSINYHKLILSVKDIIRNIKERPITNKELSSIKNAFIDNKQIALNDHDSGEWIKILSTLCQENITLESYDKYDSILKNITPKDIQNSAKIYLTEP